jgi:hypothetical protein
MEIIPKEITLKDVKEIRNYFGENDITPFQHKAFTVLDKIVKHFEKHDGRYYVDLYPSTTLLSKTHAIKRCFETHEQIRHLSFKASMYIKNVNGQLKWSDDSDVDVDKLPEGYYGKYINDVYNYESF